MRAKELWPRSFSGLAPTPRTVAPWEMPCNERRSLRTPASRSRWVRRLSEAYPSAFRYAARGLTLIFQ